MVNCNKKLDKANDNRYICNSKTGRYVKRNSKLGSKVIHSKKCKKSKSKICNKATGRLIKKNSPLGKRLSKGPVKFKKCLINKSQPGYICNPETGRWIKTDGQLGKQMIKRYGLEITDNYPIIEKFKEQVKHYSSNINKNAPTRSDYLKKFDQLDNITNNLSNNPEYLLNF